MTTNGNYDFVGQPRSKLDESVEGKIQQLLSDEWRLADAVMHDDAVRRWVACIVRECDDRLSWERKGGEMMAPKELRIAAANLSGALAAYAQTLIDKQIGPGVKESSCTRRFREIYEE